MKEPLFVSACLLGVPCRYDGQSKKLSGIDALTEVFDWIPFCPECAGGLSTPRNPCEICHGKAVTKDGIDCTAQYQKGAKLAMLCAKDHRCRFALLKEKSPSCGKNLIYDGTFTKTLIAGTGITAQKLKENRIILFNENEIDLLLTYKKQSE